MMSLVAAYSTSEGESSDNEDSNTIIDNDKSETPKSDKHQQFMFDMKTPINEDIFNISDDDEEFVNPEFSEAFNLPQPKISYSTKSVKSEKLLTSSLPEPKSTTAQKKLENEQELDDLVKPSPEELSLRILPIIGKRKGKQLILAPSLVKDNVEVTTKKKKKSFIKSTSNFLNSLPQPTQTHGLQAKSRTLETPTSSNPAIIRNAVDSGGSIDSVYVKPVHVSSDEDDDFTVQGPSSYFTFASENKLEIPEDEEKNKQIQKSSLYVENIISKTIHVPEPSTINNQATENKQYSQFTNDNYRYNGDPSLPTPITTIDDNEVKLGSQELQRLHGRHKGELHQMHIIDANASEQRSEIGQTKGLTELDSFSAGHVTHAKFDDKLSKHKHHITYLAHMAKEREFELKNQWAADRNKRRETKNKYGF